MSFNYRSWSSYHKGHKNNCSRDQVFHEKAKESAFQGTKLVAFYHIKSPKHKGNSKQLCPALGSSVEEGCGTPGGGPARCPARGHLPLPLPKPSASPAPGPLLLLRPAWHPQHPGLLPSQAGPAHRLVQDPAEFSICAKIQLLTWKTCIYTPLVFPNCQPVPAGKGQRAPFPLKRKPL